MDTYNGNMGVFRRLACNRRGRYIEMNKTKVKLDGIKKGDYILTGRFKNKKVKVDFITYDRHGMPMINGKHACTFRLYQDNI